jgi:hypothetical protein
MQKMEKGIKRKADGPLGIPVTKRPLKSNLKDPVALSLTNDLDRKEAQGDVVSHKMDAKEGPPTQISKRTVMYQQGNLLKVESGVIAHQCNCLTIRARGMPMLSARLAT